MEESFCELGWRVPLALVLQRAPHRAERVRLLRLYYTLYQEYADK